MKTLIRPLIAWTGGDCPVHPDTTVIVTYRGPANEAKGIRIGWPIRAGRLDWSHDGSDDDIVMYSIIESARATSHTERADA